MHKERPYSAACAFLDKLTDYERATGYRYDDKHFNLERTRLLLAQVGNPHLGKPGVLIAGTKGKGSTAAILTAILESSGARVGLYTSPHLVTYRERIRMGFKAVDEGKFASLAQKLEGATAKLDPQRRPTTFEVLTVMAFLHFAREGADFLVLEAGMGGRLDATNVFDASVVCITPVSMDHMDQLGGTIPEIAAEKAGIIKSAQTVICGPQLPEAMAVIERACREAGASLLRVGEELRAEDVELGPGGGRFSARTPRGRFAGLHLRLPGRHQVDNALMAVGAALSLSRSTGEPNIREGIGRAAWPGRLQSARSDPRVLLDGAHNPASAAALAQAVRELHGGRSVALVMGHLKGKEPAKFAGILCPLAARVYIAEPAHPRALPAAEFADLARPYSREIATFKNLPEALAAARRADPAAELIVVCGSLAIVGEAMSALGENPIDFCGTG